MEAKYFVFAIGFGLLFGAILVVAYSFYLKAKWGDLEKRKEGIVKDAERSAEAIRKEATIEAKDIVYQAKSEAETDLRERRNELAQLEKRLRNREEALEKKLEQTERKDGELAKRDKEYDLREKSLQEKEGRYSRLVQEQAAVLERLSGLGKEEARQELFRRVEEEARFEAAKLAKRIEEESREAAEKKAKEIISVCIQRYASEHVADSSVSTVSLPSDELKGRIIGREGRNIRALEAATGVDLIVDDTPEVVTLSAFDPVRREVARISLQKLVSDGRIHPARIEEVVDKARKEVETAILEEGERAAFDLGLSGIHPELIKLLGRLRYRFSYGQNVLQHSREVAYLAGMLAAELGVDEKFAKRAGLLHDIGKAVDHEIEGSHHEIGGRLAKRYGEKDAVVNAIEVHHGDGEAASVEAALVAAADALSAARPGVRRESIENYIKRLEKLEKMAMSYEGVEKCYAIQAGRELRLIVKPESVADESAWTIARELSKQIEQEMTYPGQIKVTVIRESRFVEFAK
ncbi:MAG: ribonuclease Y [Nitrospirota bacterium]